MGSGPADLRLASAAGFIWSSFGRLLKSRTVFYMAFPLEIPTHRSIMGHNSWYGVAWPLFSLHFCYRSMNVTALLHCRLSFHKTSVQILCYLRHPPKGSSRSHNYIWVASICFGARRNVRYMGFRRSGITLQSLFETRMP